MCLVSLVEAGDVDDVCEPPLHPNVVSLLSAVPDPDPRVRKRRFVLAGDVPAAAVATAATSSGAPAWVRGPTGSGPRLRQGGKPRTGT